jgi:3-oxoacyl-[acyl-carrier-protein] synthase II
MRVAITGLGALTPIGQGLAELREGLRAGRDGVGPITGFDASRHRVRRAAEVDWSKPADSPYSRATEMALCATSEALGDAGLGADDLGARSAGVGVILASNQGGMAPSVTRYRELNFPYRRGPAPAARLPRLLDSAPTTTLDLLMLAVGGSGPSLSVSTACSAGLHALGMGFDMLRQRQAEVVVVAAVEVLTEAALAGFSVLRALTAADAPRPFDAQRDGTLLGEGAAALVLEPWDAARARGARVWAEIAGYGSSTDAYHMTRPRAEGAARAITQALGDTPPDEVAWVKAHGTGTPANDASEAEALHAVFGARASRLPVTSLKATLGHSLGASGAVEAVAAVLALEAGFVPPTLHVEQPDPACGLDLVLGQARPLHARTVLANAFGFGGNNAAVLFRSADARPDARGSHES